MLDELQQSSLPKEKKISKATRKMFQAVEGMKDILPAEQRYWDFVEGAIKQHTGKYSFGRLETPAFENNLLFLKGVPKKAQDNLICFKSGKEENVCLRYDMLLPVLRSYIEHALNQNHQSVKVAVTGPIYREDNEKHPENKQLHQFGLYIVGEASYVADAQVIMLSYKILNEIFANLPIKLQLKVNSTGCVNCRSAYENVLTEYFKSKKKSLCAKCLTDINKSPLSIFRCEEEGCKSLHAEAPQSIDWLCEKCKNHLMKVLECLDELDVPYVLDPYIVSDKDYYTKTVFAFTADITEQGITKVFVLSEGSRHDELADRLGWYNVPLVGGSMILESLIKRLKQLQIKLEEFAPVDIFVAQLGDMAKKRALCVFEKLVKEGIPVSENLSKDNLRQQLELAAKYGAKLTLILGQQELIDGTIIIREMESGTQEIIDFNKTIPEVRKRLAKLQKS